MANTKPQKTKSSLSLAKFGSKKRGNQLKKMDVTQKIDLASKVNVDSPRLIELRQAIDKCRGYNKSSEKPRCVLITGEAGVGKTHFIGDYLRRLPSERCHGRNTHVPVLSVSVPTPLTPEALVDKLLWTIGDQLFEKDNIHVKTTRLGRYMKDCSVDMLFLDRCEHFIDTDSCKVLHQAVDWLATLIEESKITVVAVGRPDTEKVIDTDVTLWSLFEVRETLFALGYGNSRKEDIRDFLKMVEKALPFVKESHLWSDENEMAYRVYYATSGIADQIMRLLRWATEMALESDHDRLDVEILAKAFDECMIEKGGRKANPFKSPTFTSQELDILDGHQLR